MSTKLVVKLHDAFPARIAHPDDAESVAGAERLDHGPDQQIADENPPSEARVIERLCRRSPS